MNPQVSAPLSDAYYAMAPNQYYAFNNNPSTTVAQIPDLPAGDYLFLASIPICTRTLDPTRPNDWAQAAFTQTCILDLGDEQKQLHIAPPLQDIGRQGNDQACHGGGNYGYSYVQFTHYATLNAPQSVTLILQGKGTDPNGFVHFSACHDNISQGSPQPGPVTLTALPVRNLALPDPGAPSESALDVYHLAVAFDGGSDKQDPPVNVTPQIDLALGVKQTIATLGNVGPGGYLILASIPICSTTWGSVAALRIDLTLDGEILESLDVQVTPRETKAYKCSNNNRVRSCTKYGYDYVQFAFRTPQLPAPGTIGIDALVTYVAEDNGQISIGWTKGDWEDDPAYNTGVCGTSPIGTTRTGPGDLTITAISIPGADADGFPHTSAPQPTPGDGLQDDQKNWIHPVTPVNVATLPPLPPGKYLLFARVPLINIKGAEDKGKGAESNGCCAEVGGTSLHLKCNGTDLQAFRPFGAEVARRQLEYGYDYGYTYVQCTLCLSLEAPENVITLDIEGLVYFWAGGWKNDPENKYFPCRGTGQPLDVNAVGPGRVTLTAIPIRLMGSRDGLIQMHSS